MAFELMCDVNEICLSEWTLLHINCVGDPYFGPIDRWIWAIRQLDYRYTTKSNFNVKIFSFQFNPVEYSLSISCFVLKILQISETQENNVVNPCIGAQSSLRQ